MPTTSANDPRHAVDRFRGDLLALTSAPTAGAPLACAVSGGPDSMALLWLAAKAFPGAVIAATVDHGLRAEGADEARMVAGWCAAAGIDHATLRLDPPLVEGADLQARARAARYDALMRWAWPRRGVLATAHHADDQAETFLMRANRGSGPAGLAGIRPKRVGRRRDGDEVRIVRPLLDWRRAGLRALVERAGVPFVDDPSNTDARFERVAVRALIAAAPWIDAAQLARAARHAGEAHEALEAMVDWLWRTRRLDVTGDDRVALDLADLPREVRRRLARRALAWLGDRRGDAALDDGANIEPLLDALAAGRAATQGGVVVRPDGDIWRFAEAPPRRSR